MPGPAPSCWFRHLRRGPGHPGLGTTAGGREGGGASTTEWPDQGADQLTGELGHGPLLAGWALSHPNTWAERSRGSPKETEVVVMEKGDEC